MRPRELHVFFIRQEYHLHATASPPLRLNQRIRLLYSFEGLLRGRYDGYFSEVESLARSEDTPAFDSPAGVCRRRRRGGPRPLIVADQRAAIRAVEPSSLDGEG